MTTIKLPETRYNELLNRSKKLEAELITWVICLPKIVESLNVSKDDFRFYWDEFCSAIKGEDSKEILSRKDIGNYSSFSGTSHEDVVTELKKIANSIRAYEILLRAVDNFSEDNLIDDINKVQNALSNSIYYTNNDGSLKDLVDEFRKLQTEYKDKLTSGNSLIGVSTGYKKLDQIIDGLRPEHLLVIGGYTNTGKTFAVLNIVAEQIRCGRRVAFYSLEMSKIDILCRLLGILTGINGVSILKSFQHDEQKVATAFKLLEESGISIHTGPNELTEMMASMTAEHRSNPASLFVVDFLQLVRAKDAKTDYEAMTLGAVEFQKLSKKLKVPIILLSQVSNESARGSDQVVMGFKGSGAIAAAADLAIELVNGEDSIKDMREKMNAGESVKIKWQIRKNRHGRVGFMEMTFDGNTGIFRPIEEFDF